MPFILIATELALPNKKIMVILKMTLERDFILNFYDLAYYNHEWAEQSLS